MSTVPIAGFLHKQVSTAALRPDARSFKPGFIFGKDVIAEERMKSRIHLHWFRRMDLGSALGGKMPWTDWGTALEKYLASPETGAPIFGKENAAICFRDYLAESARIATEKGEVLRILDIGIGSGAQWIDFLHDYEAIFHGTAISRGLVRPEIKDRVVRSSAANLFRHFTPGFFDIVVSNRGMHMQPNSAIESAMHVLKPGGELVFSSESPGPLLFKGHNAGNMLDVVYKKIVPTSLSHDDSGAYRYKWILRATKTID